MTTTRCGAAADGKQQRWWDAHTNDRLQTWIAKSAYRVTHFSRISKTTMMIGRNTSRPRSSSSCLLLFVLIFLQQHHGGTGYSPLSTTNNNAPSSSRRRLLSTGLVTAALLFPTVPRQAAWAAANDDSKVVYERVRLGHARVKYLLDHWDDVTSVCGTTVMSDAERRQVIRTENGNICTKTPLNVQYYMGYKSIDDPLYRIDKILVRESFINKNVDDTVLVEYLEAVENYKEMADQTAMLAYTASWGEANPYVYYFVID
jgi:hypothetical protein